MYFTIESFGSYCPNNWEEIADALNDYARSVIRDYDSKADRAFILDQIWERWCQGDYRIAPEPQF